MNEIILNQEKNYKKEYEQILDAIKKYDRIAIFRHIMPDFDALGTQFGLKTWIEDNFPNKEVIALGDNHVVFTPNGLFPETNKVNDAWFSKDFLAIIVDVGDKKRIADPRFEKASLKIKLDHHPETDKIFDISVVDINLAAASELVANMVLNFEGYKLSELASKYFYIALVGDSGRFQYSSTSTHTFLIAAELIERGINITKIYEDMYIKNVEDLEIQKFILNNYHVSKAGTCYYVLKDEDLKRLNITSERGKENVNMFSNIRGVNIWCSITEDVTEPCFRISIRSRNYIVNDIATEFKGGGHAQASGCQIKDLSELDKFIEACDKKILSEGK